MDDLCSIKGDSKSLCSEHNVCFREKRVSLVIFKQVVSCDTGTLAQSFDSYCCLNMPMFKI